MGQGGKKAGDNTLPDSPTKRKKRNSTKKNAGKGKTQPPPYLVRREEKEDQGIAG